MFRRVTGVVGQPKFVSTSAVVNVAAAAGIPSVQQRFGGSGNPKGKPGWRPPHPFAWSNWVKKQKMGLHPQYMLDLMRPRKDPPTRHFPDGVPFKLVFGLEHYKGEPADKPGKGTRRKVYFSTKRGRKLGLAHYKIVKKKPLNTPKGTVAATPAKPA